MPSETVKVMVRCRPMNKLELGKGCGFCVAVNTQTNQIVLTNNKDTDATKVFTFDYVFPPDILQQTVYENSAFPLVESVVEGYNGTIFAYGQTGCGKTHSMLGLPNDEVEKGIIPRTFSHILNIVESANDKNFLIRCSYMEIYNEEIHDLLGKEVKARMDLKESPDKGVFVKDLTMNVVKSVAEMERWMNIGTQNRSVGATAMNKDSSRSHSLFTLYIECSFKTEGEQDDHITAGKLNLVDLAGSERQSKTNATGDRLKEATKINLSLSALGNVISALVDGKSQHIPYRDSKLTRLLQDSLGGNTKTIMIAAVSPADYNYEETLSTLRYASRAKNIKNQPVVNQDPKDALLKEYADEIQKLKDLLSRQGGESMGGNIQMNNGLKSQKSMHAQVDKGMSGQGQNIKTEEFKKLKETNDILNAEREQMENELMQKEKLYQQQIEDKGKIERMLKEFEMKMMVGGTADQDKKKKISQMRSKLKRQIQEHDKIQDEMKQKEEDFLFLEDKYSSLQEELDATKRVARNLRVKLKQAQSDVKDVEKEQEMQKEDFLDTIRYQSREIKIYQSISLMLLTQNEIDIIKTQGEWQDDYSIYKIPPFYLKQKKLTFPKLPPIQGQDVVNQEKQMREIEFTRNENVSNGKRNVLIPDEQIYTNTMRKFTQNDGSFNETSKFQFGQANNFQKSSQNNRGSSMASSAQYEEQEMNESLINHSQQKQDKNSSPNIRIKKNGQRQGNIDSLKVPHVSLDPIDSSRVSRTNYNTQDSQMGDSLSYQTEQRRQQHKNVQLQPISSGIRSSSSVQSASILGALKQSNNSGIDFDYVSKKTSNKIKLDAIKIPR